MYLKRFLKVTGLFASIIIAVVFQCIEIQASMIYWTDFEFTAFENIDCSMAKTNLKVKRYNRTHSGFSGTIELKTEFNDDWTFEAYLLYSSKGNNQFVRLPYKFLKQDLCSFFDGMFTKYRMPEILANASDFPAPQENVSLCILYKRGNYTIKDLTLASETFVKYLRPGYYKGQAILSSKNSTDVLCGDRSIDRPWSTENSHYHTYIFNE